MRNERTNLGYIAFSDPDPAISLKLGRGLVEGFLIGRNLSRNSVTGIGPTKCFLISESILERNQSRGWRIAAYLRELLQVFFAGELDGGNSMAENDTQGKAGRATYLQLRFLNTAKGPWM